MTLTIIARKVATVALIVVSSLGITLGVIVGMHMALLAAFTAFSAVR